MDPFGYNLSSHFSHMSLHRSNAHRRGRRSSDDDLGSAFDRVSVGDNPSHSRSSGRHCELLFRVYDCGHNPAPQLERYVDCGECTRYGQCRPTSRDVKVSGVCPNCREAGRAEKERRSGRYYADRAGSGSPGRGPSGYRQRSRSPRRDRDRGFGRLRSRSPSSGFGGSSTRWKRW